MDNLFSDIIERNLLKEEKILWAGKPVVRKQSIHSNKLQVLGSIFCGIVLLFMLIVGVLFALLGLIFIGIGYYFMVGRFKIEREEKEKTLYAVTDKRILIFKVTKREEVVRKYINEIKNIDISISNDGIGTIRFGEIPLHTRMSDATGIKSTLDYFGEGIPTFYDIPDAKKVYELVNSLKNEM
ncbi:MULTISPECIES: hypothetical protein [unclassified Clostridium]|uniref:hypothetical protein n=1 Tax=unclassified Clostridium TaxID=2614128 RepID=UPI0002974428|nr:MULTISPECIES: hypothetical protein [unclassified Clostridium]EKQ50979.1 MAG: hypothetical protein A370_05261 [Clostridium sp. Maddingley MBC34-26]